MKKIILNAVKYFAFLFLIIKAFSYILNKGDFKEIGLQTLLIAVFSIEISIRDYNKI
jgi:hypothetical protein